ncbi:tRNA lysidine(34) synthetase TilS [Rhizobium sp. ICMP 5592]|uniref:tRNA lysidine(34) synthetase TilS n=1 Tax=Rhizobium sp. ICMP 5592 TaxID=2292445 RepID=UPI001296CB99|nr:tRNA lysidine(34) synthetase TilS [Rhizobium sp. ICMP 5592]MQB42069.1 tRNA lysidine(34) synthetase TilS [Rhizobium sp. ICMP 5592]
MSADAANGAATVQMPEAAAADFVYSLFKPAHILVAISGGSDSTGLLVALAEHLKSLPNSDVTLSAATIDHGLRAESAGEAREVAAFCASLGIAHVIRRWEGEKPTNGIMAAAREARYGLLADIAAEISANVIVTAHTIDDQRETLAMRTARLSEDEAGADTGIAEAMLFDRRIWIVRPFLTCRRADIRAYLGARGMSWLDDPSNEDVRYERVRTRKHLSQEPALFPRPEAGAARAALSDAAAAWLRDYVTVHAGALCTISCKALAADEAVIAYALSYLAAVFGGEPYGPGRERMRRILDFIGESRPGRRTAGGVVFDLRRDGLYLMRESRDIRPLVLAAGAVGVWDGRFRIVNCGASAIRVEAAGPTGTMEFPDELPKGAVQRARAALPKVIVGDEGTTVSVTITPYLAPFDRFLTRFNFTFANRLATCLGREPYMPPPL